MALPQPDPSLPGGAAPVFGDTDAARGDHLRANNQAIWENLEYLNAGENINDASAATPADADRVGFFQIAGSIIKYVTFANLFLWIITKVAALASKTTPADADGVLLIDSAASNVGKLLSWANIKATLKTYFDTLYAPVSVTITSPTAWTPTFTGFGSVTGITARWWRVGSIMHGEVRFVAGASSVDIASFTLPNSLQTASTYPTLAHVGTGSNTSNANTITVVAEASNNVIYVGCVHSALGKPGLAPRSGNSIVSSGDGTSFQFAVQISGW